MSSNKFIIALAFFLAVSSVAATFTYSALTADQAQDNQSGTIKTPADFDCWTAYGWNINANTGYNYINVTVTAHNAANTKGYYIPDQAPQGDAHYYLNAHGSGTMTFVVGKNICDYNQHPDSCIRNQVSFRDWTSTYYTIYSNTPGNAPDFSWDYGCISE